MQYCFQYCTTKQKHLRLYPLQLDKLQLPKEEGKVIAAPSPWQTCVPPHHSSWSTASSRTTPSTFMRSTSTARRWWRRLRSSRRPKPSTSSGAAAAATVVVHLWKLFCVSVCVCVFLCLSVAVVLFLLLWFLNSKTEFCRLSHRLFGWPNELFFFSLSLINTTLAHLWKMQECMYLATFTLSSIFSHSVVQRLRPSNCCVINIWNWLVLACHGNATLQKLLHYLYWHDGDYATES